MACNPTEKKEYVSRRTIVFDDSDSQGDAEGEQDQQSGMVEYLDTKG